MYNLVIIINTATLKWSDYIGERWFIEIEHKSSLTVRNKTNEESMNRGKNDGISLNIV